MMLEALINGLETPSQKKIPPVEICGIAYDSRQVKPGYLFVAMRGHAQDGHAYITQALQKGAAAVVHEAEVSVPHPAGRVPMIRVRDGREALSKLAARFYGNPQERMHLIGITGTNGKTTTSYLLESILLKAGFKTGVVGTVNYRRPGRTWNAPVTTPESLDLMRALKDMADSEVSHVVVEVSSHALDQGRTRDCPFRMAVFTNLSRDHLDYHGSMDDYFRAKSRLFSGLNRKKDAIQAVINLDDERARELIRLTPAGVLTYGLGEESDVRALDVAFNPSGITATLKLPGGSIPVRTSLIGGFNIYNILAAGATGSALGLGPDLIASGIGALKGVPGRLERVQNPLGLNIVVDYSHTPDALLKAIQALRPLTRGRLITVFGCGGDRDRGKRREMGLVAARQSDLVFVTSDNPRTEDPAFIASQIEEGVREAGLAPLSGTGGKALDRPGYVLDVDRERAIQRAVQIAGTQDTVLVAGKGHEDYQIIGTKKRPFDDREVAAAAASG